jgi:hypothetical protein
MLCAKTDLVDGLCIAKCRGVKRLDNIQGLPAQRAPYLPSAPLNNSSSDTPNFTASAARINTVGL